jgi:hypothetical protein
MDAGGKHVTKKKQMHVPDRDGELKRGRYRGGKKRSGDGEGKE